MNKEELVKKIDSVPLFVLRDVSVKEMLVVDEDAGLVFASQHQGQVMDDCVWVEQNGWKAVTEENNLSPLAFVCERYRLMQFKEVFTPLIQNIPELEGDLVYYGGIAILQFFPLDEKLKEGDDRIGITAVNSVNKTSSVIIKFCILHDGKVITFPKKFASFKRMHVGKAIQVTQNFLHVTDKVREIWKTILSEFNKVLVDDAYANTMMDKVEIKDNYLRKKVLQKIESSTDVNLWDVFIYMMEVIEQRNFKSELHRRKKLDLISEKMFSWAIEARLINA